MPHRNLSAAPLDAGVVSGLRRISRVFAAIAVAVGAATLVGWSTGYQDFWGLLPGHITIKTNTGIGLILTGAALLCLASEPVSRWRRILGSILAGLAGALGLATLSQHVFGWDLGIDQLLFVEPPGSVATASPNRMGPPASISFPLLAAALLLIDRRGASGRARFQWFAMVVGLLSLTSIIGYVFHVRELFGVARYTGIAFSTAVTFELLALGTLFARPHVGVTRQLAASDGGGMLIRRLLPAAVIAPVVLGWLRTVGEDAGFYDASFGRTLLVLGFIMVFSVLTWWTAATISKADQARWRAEAAEGRMQERLVQALESERAARRVAEQSNRAKDEFLATLSHELRTPLHAILGWVHLLHRSPVSPADLERGIETIERNARLQARLVDDLLDMNRIVSGKLRLELQPVSLPAVVEAALETAAPAAEARRIRVVRRIEPAPPLHGDPARLQQVLWNLISNAIKFTPPGGEVTVALRTVESDVEIAVSDTGIGIAPDALERVFERFRQADASSTREHGGLGLGLTIARQLAEMHGGSLTAHSEGRDRGATFTLRLPVPAGVALPPPAATPRGRPAPDDHDRASLEGVRVLVVEDQSDARELIERVLREQSADVRSAEGVGQALELYARGRFDVVVSDLAMPGRDGYDLMRELRARGETVPAIALSAFARSQDAERVRAAGYQVHLTKPIQPAELASAVALLAARPAGIGDR